MRRLFIIIGLLVIIPIIEIGVLIAVGKVIGLGWTLVLMFATSAIGGWLLRTQGGRAWRAFRAEINAGRPPGNAATDGLLVLAGGVFMLVPGFVSDVIGLFLIAPPTRRLARGVVLHLVSGRMSPATATSLFGPRRVRVRYANPPHRGPAERQRPDPVPPDAIEGEIIDPR